MTNIAIKADKVTLTYKHPPRNGIKGCAERLLKRKPLLEEKDILKNISFTLKKGEGLSVIGANGSGKTALLKTLAGIMTPTSGRIIARGNISPVFSESKGFNSSMTVKGNIYLTGSMRGFSKEYMRKRIPDIVSFGELEDVLNTKIKKCPPEITSRLAVSIAAFIKTDILIIDEALSVCGYEFCEKALEKISEMKKNGTAVIFVSYSGEQIITLCEKAIWLENGKRKMLDEAEKVCMAYNEFYESLDDN